jgi:type II secretory pathway pseudopilin PulG
MLVAMLGAGLAIAGESYSIAAQRDKEQELLFIGAQYRAALRSYRQAQIRGGLREYPASLEDLLKDNRFPGTRRHLRRLYRDPMTGTTEWGVVRVAGRIIGVHSLSEGTPLKQAGFDIDDAEFEGAETYADWVFMGATGPGTPGAEREDEGVVPGNPATETNR